MRPQVVLFLVLGVCLSFGIAACERDRVAGPGGDAPVTSQTDAERAESVARMRDIVASIMPDHLDPPEGANAEIADAFRELPELAQAEAVPGGVWARFHDGENLFVFNSRIESDIPEDAVSPDSAAYLGEVPGAFADPIAALDEPRVAANASVPSSKKARLINTMGTAFMNSVPVIRPWLTSAGYEVFVPADGSVEALRAVTGDGVVYYSGHGLPSKDPQGPMALWTTTRDDSAGVRHYRAELSAASGRLAHGIGSVDRSPPPIPGGVGRTTYDTRIVITERFIHDFWRPASGALIYLDACYGLDPRLLNVLQNTPVNADAVVGWTDQTLDDLATASARFYFDRVLGANATPPFRNPPQRPFDAASVMAAMAELKRKNGLTFDTSAKLLGPIPVPPIAKLRLQTRGAEFTHILRPGIAFVSIAEISSPGWIQLSGDFGSSPGTVFFNNQALRVQSGEWSSSRIRCDRPSDDAVFSGDLVVEVGGHRSNPRRITGWQMDCSIHWQEFGPVCPTCQWDATWRGKLRADVDLVRSRPETRPRHGIQTSSATAAQQLVFDAVSGSYRIRLDTEYDVSWSRGSAGSLAVIGVCLGYLPVPDYVGLCFTVEPGNHRMTLQPAFETKPINALYVPVSGTGNQSGTQRAFATFYGNFPGRGGTATLDAGTHIIEGEQPGGPGQTVLRWTGAAPQHAPVPSTPK